MTADEEHELLKQTAAKTTSLKEQLESAHEERDGLRELVLAWIAEGQQLNERLVANTAQPNAILARWDVIVKDLQQKLGRGEGN